MAPPRRSSRKGKGQHSQVEVPVNLAGNAAQRKLAKAPPAQAPKPKTMPGPVKKTTKVSALRKSPIKQPAVTKASGKGRGRGRPKGKGAVAQPPSAPVAQAASPVKAAAPKPRREKKSPTPKTIQKKSVNELANVTLIQLEKVKEIEAKAAQIGSELTAQLKQLQDNIRLLEKQIKG
eukprot:TRINITY_DN6953_c0_g3_i2.p1 TRINITY_DN6953_c0_g3~~TRINITY_DN6953_c0_g3_i2.p1  ORF type:complete len:206 (+),score=27.68 TRINITY_DN6953_c0_g3_i2:88-618(+)